MSRQIANALRPVFSADSAAAAGLGIGLVRRCLVLEELAAGRVVAPFDLAVEARQGYFLCYPEDKRPKRIDRLARPRDLLG